MRWVSQRSRGGSASPGTSTMPVGAEPELGQARAVTERGGQAREAVAGAEQHAKAPERPHVVWKASSVPRPEVEHLQRVSEAEDLARNLRQPVGEAQFPRAGEVAAAQGVERVGRGGHAGGVGGLISMASSEWSREIPLVTSTSSARAPRVARNRVSRQHPGHRRRLGTDPARAALACVMLVLTHASSHMRAWSQA